MAEQGLINIDSSEVSRLQAEGAVVIDVRRADEWRATGIVPNSRLLTAFDENGHFEPEFLDAVLRDTNTDDTIVLICRSGARSGAVGQLLVEQQGYSTIYNVAGGMIDWIQRGYGVDACDTC